MQLLQTTDTGIWLCTQGSDIYLSNGKLPQGNAEQVGLIGKKGMIIGTLDNVPLWLVEEIPNDSRLYSSLREQLSLPERTFNLLSRGVELNYFFKTHQFCGKCGSATSIATDEWAMQCDHCGFRCYPVICPSIIVAVRWGKRILLANHLRHQQTKLYTTLAGFVEVGESFEQTVEREVFEETGIKVKNIQYIHSQPWAFPNSQMVGFLAEYAGGEIQLQETELCDAKWFHCDETLPQLPESGTIARKLIDITLAICKREEEL